jgi:hypothetical protein
VAEPVGRLTVRTGTHSARRLGAATAAAAVLWLSILQVVGAVQLASTGGLASIAASV